MFFGSAINNFGVRELLQGVAALAPPPRPQPAEPEPIRPEEESVAGFVDNAFIRLLDEILQNEDKPVLTCIVQVVLEGWGISHYHALMRNCLDGDLRATFEKIIKDEARHHASGVILFNEQQPTANQQTAIIDTLRRLLLMVQIGPQAVVAQIEREGLGIFGQAAADERDRRPRGWQPCGQTRSGLDGRRREQCGHGVEGTEGGGGKTKNPTRLSRAWRW